MKKNTPPMQARQSKKLIPTLLALILWGFSVAALGAIRGGEDTVVVYDADTHKGASWKVVREADIEDGGVLFRSITGWDRNNFLILGDAGFKLLLRKYNKAKWVSKNLPIEGHYASYRARMCGLDTFLFAYSGRSGTYWSMYQEATEARLGDWSGLRLSGAEFHLAAMYRVGDKTFIHPCRHNRVTSRNDQQVFVSDGTAIEPLSRGEKGYFILDPTGKDAGMVAGSIVEVQAPNATTRVGLCNYELLQTTTSAQI